MLPPPWAQSLPRPPAPSFSHLVTQVQAVTEFFLSNKDTRMEPSSWGQRRQPLPGPQPAALVLPSSPTRNVPPRLRWPPMPGGCPPTAPSLCQVVLLPPLLRSCSLNAVPYPPSMLILDPYFDSYFEESIFQQHFTDETPPTQKRRSRNSWGHQGDLAPVPGGCPRIGLSADLALPWPPQESTLAKPHIPAFASRHGPCWGNIIKSTISQPRKPVHTGRRGRKPLYY